MLTVLLKSVLWGDQVRKVDTHVEKKIITILKGYLKWKGIPSSVFVPPVLARIAQSNWAKAKLRRKAGEGIRKSKDFS